MKLAIWLIVLLGVFQVHAQQDSLENDWFEKYAQSITGEDIQAHLSFLADDLLEGRETGTRGQKLAAAYIRSQFMRVGLKPGNPETGGFYQPYFLRKIDITSAEITFDDSTYIYRSDFFAIEGNLPDSLNQPLVFAGFGIQKPGYDNLQHVDLSDKIALIYAGVPSEISPQSLSESLDQWSKRAKELQKAGAAHACLILPDSAFRPLSRFIGLRGTQVVRADQNLFGVICISEKMGKHLLSAAIDKPDKLKKALDKSDDWPTVDFSKFSWEYDAKVVRDDIPAENVVGLLEGTDKSNEILVLTAHFDHIGVIRGNINNGADDDGSGTSAILELAEAFAMAAKDGARPRRSILFMTVSGEEKGLLGSNFYTQNPLYPLDQTIVNLNIDMIGRIDEKYETREDSTNYVYLIGSDKLSSELHAISESANEQFTSLTLDYTFNDENDPNRFYYRSDHYNFAKNNIPVIFYFTGVHEDYHRPTDDIDKIKLEKTAKITRLVFSTAWELANREKTIEVDSAKP